MTVYISIPYSFSHSFSYLNATGVSNRGDKGSITFLSAVNVPPPPPLLPAGCISHQYLYAFNKDNKVEFIHFFRSERFSQIQSLSVE